jgi:hypothetical protein
VRIPALALPLTLGLLGALSPSVARAQAAPPVAPWPLIGRVERPDGTRLDGVEVDAGGQRARSDADGYFRLTATRRDTLTVFLRRLGHTPIAVTLRAEQLRGDTLLFLMEPAAQTLDALRVDAASGRSPLGLGGFDERRARGIGTFVTRDEIERRHTSRLSDVIRGRRGILLVRTAGGGFGVRFSVASGRLRRCIPDLWLDGQRARGMELDDIPANTVEGIELYATLATVPFQFSTGGAGMERCGTIVVWSRPPG